MGTDGQRLPILGAGGWEGVEVMEVFQSENIVSTELTMNQQAASHPCMNK